MEFTRLNVGYVSRGIHYERAPCLGAHGPPGNAFELTVSTLKLIGGRVMIINDGSLQIPSKVKMIQVSPENK